MKLTSLISKINKKNNEQYIYHYYILPIQFVNFTVFTTQNEKVSFKRSSDYGKKTLPQLRTVKPLIEAAPLIKISTPTLGKFSSFLAKFWNPETL